MFVASNIVGSTIQITTLPLPVLSTLQASGLVFNTAFATLMLKEPFTRFSLIGTILTSAGAALIAIFGAIGEPAHSLSQLLDLLYQAQFIIWMAATLFVVVGTILFAHVLKAYSSHKPLEQHLPKAERTRSASVSNARSESLGRSIITKLPQPIQLRIGRMRLIRGLSYALISGILSAHSLLVAKSAVELIVRTIIDHQNQFNHFQSWIILLALIFLALSQLYYLHLGLRLCSTSVLYPFVFCIYNIIAILDGLIYFRQVSRLSALHTSLIAVGTVILLTGVLALSWRLDDSIPTGSAVPQVVPPPTSLTTGMGLIRSLEDSETSPLLPTARPRSSRSASRRSINEQTPLIYHRPCPIPTLSINAPPQGSYCRDIWAELDDDGEDEQDFLASLPRTPSFLKQDTGLTRKRSRGDSTSSLRLEPKDLRVDRGSLGGNDNLSNKPQRQSQTLQTNTKGEYRRSSAPGRPRMELGIKSPMRKSADVLPRLEPPEDQKANGSAVEEGADEERARMRSSSAAVRFASQTTPSRRSIQGRQSGVRKTKDDDNEGDPGG